MVEDLSILAQEVSSTSWILDNRFLIERKPTTPPNSNSSWNDGRHVSFTITEVAKPPDTTMWLSTLSPFELITCRARSAVWFVGEAVLKIQTGKSVTRTPEHATLSYLKARLQNQPRSFKMPKMHFHATIANRAYLVTQKLSGKCINEVWPILHEDEKKRFASLIGKACKELASIKGAGLTGINGKGIGDRLWRCKGPSVEGESARACRGIGLDCSEFVFYHGDLNPGNILVDRNAKSISLIDWGFAGFFPKDWVATKFKVEPHLHLQSQKDPRNEYTRLVMKALKKEGFSDSNKKFRAWEKKFEGK